VSLEHTAKNKMILAVKELLAQLDQVKHFYGIREQCLETLIQQDPALAQAR
jgi:hypothetical protein